MCPLDFRLAATLDAMEVGARAILAHLAQQRSMNEAEVREIYDRLAKVARVLMNTKNVLEMNLPDEASRLPRLGDGT